MVLEKKKYLVASLLLIAFLVYSFHLYSSLPYLTTPGSAAACRGKLIWQKYNCTSCHQIYGLGGYLGPDLTNAYSMRGPEYIRVFLQSGTTTMPNFHLKEDEITGLIAYLQKVDSSGKSDPRTFTINTNGTIEQR